MTKRPFLHLGRTGYYYELSVVVLVVVVQKAHTVVAEPVPLMAKEFHSNTKKRRLYLLAAYFDANFEHRLLYQVYIIVHTR